MKRALIIRHSPAESLGENYTQVLESHGLALEPLNVFESAPGYLDFSPPEPQELDLIFILGGPLSANDDYPALHLERDYLKRALELDVPVFGVCLGAQLMAAALGAAVEPTGGYQFGLRRISVTAQGATDPVFRQISIPLVPTLHGESFSIPHGAVSLAEGFMLRRDGRYKRINMAFRYRNSYGFQFEPQLTLAELKHWNAELADDYRDMGDNFDPAEEAARNLREFTGFAEYHQAQMSKMLVAFLEKAGLAIPK